MDQSRSGEADSSTKFRISVFMFASIHKGQVCKLYSNKSLA